MILGRKIPRLEYANGSPLAQAAGCVEAIQPDLRRLVDTARRIRPDKDNLYAKVEYSRTAWERIQQGVDHWARRLKR